jgi:hypothetical protein
MVLVLVWFALFLLLAIGVIAREVLKLEKQHKALILLNELTARDEKRAILYNQALNLRDGD